MAPPVKTYTPPPGFQRWRLTVAWDGAAYAGWQAQHNAPSVQDTLQAALLSLGGARLAGSAAGASEPAEAFRPVAAGRTDAGVHAEAMPLHWDLPSSFGVPPQQLARALNAKLPPDIAVLSAGHAPPNFHARFSCLERRYVYRLWLSPQRHPLWQGRALHVHGNLDAEAMNRAAKLLVGEHDFAAFATREDRQTVRELRHLEVRPAALTLPGGEIWEIQVVGESFLRHMVRGLVGTLLQVGQGRLPAEDVQAVLASRQRAQAGANVAACGLYFAGARYAIQGEHP